jgi:hemerythrin-like domain-containing protein
VRINEIITESEQLEEGWKQNLAAAALAAGAALGGAGTAQAQLSPEVTSLGASLVSKSFANEQINKFIEKANKEDLMKLIHYIGIIEPYYEAGDLNKYARADFLKAKKMFKLSSYKIFSDSEKNKARAIYDNAYKKSQRELEKDPVVVMLPGVTELDDLIDSVLERKTPVQKTGDDADYDIYDYLADYLEHQDSESGEITPDLVNKLGARGLSNMLKSYQNFLSDLKKIKSASIRTEYIELLKILYDDIQLYSKYLLQSSGSPTTGTK